MAGPSQNEMDIKAVLTQIFGENINKEFKLFGHQVLIGRSPRSHIRIFTPSVSRKHCVLTRAENGWSVKDCKSQNGTYINGRQLREDEEYMFQCGDILFLGPPSELPQAFSYEEKMGNESDEDILELSQKSASEDIAKISSKKTALHEPTSSNFATLKRPSSPWISAEILHFSDYISDGSDHLSDCSSPVKTVPPAPQKSRKQRRIDPTPSISTNSNNTNSSNSMVNIAGSSKSKVNPAEINIDNVEQFYEISSTNNYECNDSQSLLHTNDLQDSHEETEEIKNDEVFEKESNKIAEKEKDIESKLALLAEEVKSLQASKLELLKNYKNVVEKNKELVEKDKKHENELQKHEMKAKNEVKSELLEKFEEDLVCNICTELFIKPTVLDCSHTFCQFCIKEWRKKKNDCPICRCKIKNMTQVRTLEQFIDKTLATLTPDQKLTRANVIAERTLAERPPPPPDPRLTPRRRRGSHRRRTYRHPSSSSGGSSGIQVVTEIGRPDRHMILRMGPNAPPTTSSSSNLIDLTSMGISVIFR